MAPVQYVSRFIHLSLSHMVRSCDFSYFLGNVVVFAVDIANLLFTLPVRSSSMNKIYPDALVL